MLIEPDENKVNTRGCGPLMKYWFRRGFWENIFMSLFGVFMGVYMLFVFQRNRKEFVQLRDEADDRKRMIRTHSQASVREANNNNTKETIKTKPKNSTSGYSYTGMRSSPSNGASGGYDSDDNSGSVLYQPRHAVDPNA
jgi:hypothetical protein